MKNFQINRILPLTYIEQSFALHLRLGNSPQTTSNTRINYWLVQWLIKFPIAYRITISWMMLLGGIDCLGGSTFQPNIFNGNRKICYFWCSPTKGTQFDFLPLSTANPSSSRFLCCLVAPFLPFADESDTLCRELSNYIDSINDTVNICQSNYSFTLSLFIRRCADCSISKKKQLQSYCGTRLARHE